MTYSVYQHWDPLKVCVVGKSYPPEFYSFITNSRVRNVMERIAYETEEDYQKLIKLLESFGVEVLRPNISAEVMDQILRNKEYIIPPPMTPRDYTIMLGDTFHFKMTSKDVIKEFWKMGAGVDWPDLSNINAEVIAKLNPKIFNEIDTIIRNEFNASINDLEKVVHNPMSLFSTRIEDNFWSSVMDHISCSNKIVNIGPRAFSKFSGATTTRVGKDIYRGTDGQYNQDPTEELKIFKNLYPEYRWHSVNTRGHSDGVFCPVVPGLIVSLRDIPTYKDTFPGWEVVYLPGQSYAKIKPFLKLKRKNRGKWWVPGEELNDEFTDFVESWLKHWVGYVEETVFDVNMLVIDEKNVVVNNYNEQVFRAFERYGITPHVINFRHRYFWDGGLHCITSDVHREGTMKDYFPERG